MHFPRNFRLFNLAVAGLLSLSAMPAFGQGTGDPAKDFYYKWDLGHAADISPDAPAHFTSADRVEGTGVDGAASYRMLKTKAYQVSFVMPGFDFDPKFYDTANHNFYMKIHFKDICKGRLIMQSYKGGPDFYGYCFAGSFGGEADNEWKDAYVVIHRSILRSIDGKHFGFTITGISGIPDAVPISSIELYSEASPLPDIKERVDAAEKYDRDRRENYKKAVMANPKWKRLPLPNPGEAPAMSAEETAAGYRVFFPPITRSLLQNSEPLKDELETSLHWAGVGGQIESHIIALKSAKDLGNVKVELSTINDRAIPHFSPVLRWAEFREYRVGSSWSQDYRVAPHQLLEHPSQPVGPDEIEIACLNITLPENAPAGEYKTELVVTPEHGLARRFPLQITVYPFKLDHPAHSTHGCFYYGSQGSTDPVELIDMHNHGMDSLVDGIVPSVEKDSSGQYKGTQDIRKEWALLKQFGYKSPIFINSGGLSSLMKHNNEKEYVGLIKLAKSLAEESGFTDTPFFPVDEPQTDVLIAEATKAFKWTREVEGARTYVTANPSAVDKLGNLLDDVSYNLAYMNLKAIEGVKKSGQTLMYYASGVGVDPEAGRFRAGFYLNRTGAVNMQFFAYYAPALDPFLDLDAGTHDWTPVFPSRTSVFHNPTLIWESIREGVNDYKYAYTLQTMIEQAQTSGHGAAAAKAKKVLDEVLNAVNVDDSKAEGPLLAIEADTRLKNQNLDVQTMSHIHNQMDSSWYDQARNKIAAAIVELQAGSR